MFKKIICSVLLAGVSVLFASADDPISPCGWDRGEYIYQCNTNLDEENDSIIEEIGDWEASDVYPIHISPYFPHNEFAGKYICEHIESEREEGEK